MKIYNKSNIIRYKNNYYCKVKIKTINLLFKYKTKSLVLITENEPYMLGDTVCLFETDNKKITESCHIVEYQGQEEHLINKLVTYGNSDVISYLHDTNEIKDFNILLVKAKKIFGLYFIDEQDENVVYESLLNNFNKKETKFETWFYNFKEKYFI